MVRMKRRTKENIMGAVFFIGVLCMVNMQEKKSSATRFSMYDSANYETTEMRKNMQSSEGKRMKVKKIYSAHDIESQSNSNFEGATKNKNNPNSIELTEYSDKVPEHLQDIMSQIHIMEDHQQEKAKKEAAEKEKNNNDKDPLALAGDNNNEDIPFQPTHPSNVGRIPLPSIFDNIADLLDPVKVVGGSYGGGGEIPFFWHVARAGGSTVKDIMGACLDLVQASDVGARYGNHEDEDLKVVRLHGGKYANVDTTTYTGIGRAKKLFALESGLVEVVVSPRLYATSTLFTPENKGRLFVFLRDPVERALSMFYYLGYATWEKNYSPEIVDMDVKEYAKTSYAENNWMVRSLIGKMEGYLTMLDLELAKEVLRRKTLIGLMEEKHLSMKRFEQYFGWNMKAKLPGIDECEDKYLTWGWSNKHKHPPLEEGSEAYELLYKKNYLDVLLYEYAKVLFKQQGVVLGLDKKIASSAVAGGATREKAVDDDMAQ